MRQPFDVLLWALGACAAFLPMIVAVAAQAAGESAQIIQARVGQLASGGEVRVGAAPIASTVVLPSFYERRAFEPAWTDADNWMRCWRRSTTASPTDCGPRITTWRRWRRCTWRPGSPARDADLDLLAT